MRGYLGMHGRDVPIARAIARLLGLHQETGVEVMGLEPDGPAPQSGMSEGDLIVSLGEQPITGLEDLQKRLWRSPSGSRPRSTSCETIAGSRGLSSPANTLAWTSERLAAHPYPANRRSTTAVFWPPNPKLFESATSSFISLAAFGT